MNTNKGYEHSTTMCSRTIKKMTNDYNPSTRAKTEAKNGYKGKIN